MSLWVDKYRPIELSQCEHVNADVANHLKELVKDGDCPHCTFFLIINIIIVLIFNVFRFVVPFSSIFKNHKREELTIISFITTNIDKNSAILWSSRFW